jgi:hypothetical protein
MTIALYQTNRGLYYLFRGIRGEPQAPAAGAKGGKQ